MVQLEICKNCLNSPKFCHCSDKFLHLTKEESRGLYEYFLKVGYISHEDYEYVHTFIVRLKEFIK